MTFVNPQKPFNTVNGTTIQNTVFRKFWLKISDNRFIYEHYKDQVALIKIGEK